jgi:hypothetical protein
MQRRSSSELASGSVHGMTCALSCVRGGLAEFDPYLVELATPNWHGRMAKSFIVTQNRSRIRHLTAAMQFAGEPSK